MSDLPKRALGPSGLEVSILGLGGMPMSIAGRPDEAQSIAVVHAALEAGITLIDTADVYCLDDGDLGHNERLIAKALASAGRGTREVLVATKGGLRRPGGAWTTDARPGQLREACERSLRALGVERIGLYQLHAVDDRVPLEESVGELARLRAEGKIVHVGLSNVDLGELERALQIVPIASVQNRFHVRDRRFAIDSGVLRRCEELGIAFLPYSPVGGGRGKEKLGQDRALLRVGEKHGATAHEVALAWLFTISDKLFPIPGASRVESVRSSVRAASLRLDDEDLKVIG